MVKEPHPTGRNIPVLSRVQAIFVCGQWQRGWWGGSKESWNSECVHKPVASYHLGACYKWRISAPRATKIRIYILTRSLVRDTGSEPGRRNKPVQRRAVRHLFGGLRVRPTLRSGPGSPPGRCGRKSAEEAADCKC